MQRANDWTSQKEEGFWRALTLYTLYTFQSSYGLDYTSVAWLLFDCAMSVLNEVILYSGTKGGAVE